MTLAFQLIPQIFCLTARLVFKDSVIRYILKKVSILFFKCAQAVDVTLNHVFLVLTGFHAPTGVAMLCAACLSFEPMYCFERGEQCCILPPLCSAGQSLIYIFHTSKWQLAWSQSLSHSGRKTSFWLHLNLANINFS